MPACIQIFTAVFFVLVRDRERGRKRRRERGRKRGEREEKPLDYIYIGMCIYVTYATEVHIYKCSYINIYVNSKMQTTQAGKKGTKYGLFIS